MLTIYMPSMHTHAVLWGSDCFYKAVALTPEQLDAAEAPHTGEHKPTKGKG